MMKPREMVTMYRPSHYLLNIIVIIMIITTTQAIPSCTRRGGIKKDIVFVLDSSGSVGHKNFMLLRQFVHDIVVDMDVRLYGIRVAVITFSSSIHFVSYFNRDAAKSRLLRKIAEMRFRPGWTRTHLALERMNDIIMTPKRGDRPNVENVIVVVTDGVSVNETATTQMAAVIHRRDDVKMISIGVGSGVRKSEVKAIASAPEFVHFVSGFKNLVKLTHRIKLELCKNKRTTTSTPSTTTKMTTTTTTTTTTMETKLISTLATLKSAENDESRNSEETNSTSKQLTSTTSNMKQNNSGNANFNKESSKAFLTISPKKTPIKVKGQSSYATSSGSLISVLKTIARRHKNPTISNKTSVSRINKNLRGPKNIDETKLLTTLPGTSANSVDNSLPTKMTTSADYINVSEVNFNNMTGNVNATLHSQTSSTSSPTIANNDTRMITRENSTQISSEYRSKNKTLSSLTNITSASFQKHIQLHPIQSTTNHPKLHRTEEEPKTTASQIAVIAIIGGCVLISCVLWCVLCCMFMLWKRRRARKIKINKA